MPKKEDEAARELSTMKGKRSSGGASGEVAEHDD